MRKQRSNSVNMQHEQPQERQRLNSGDDEITPRSVQVREGEHVRSKQKNDCTRVLTVLTLPKT